MSLHKLCRDVYICMSVHKGGKFLRNMYVHFLHVGTKFNQKQDFVCQDCMYGITQVECCVYCIYSQERGSLMHKGN